MRLVGLCVEARKSIICLYIHENAKVRGEGDTLGESSLYLIPRLRQFAMFAPCADLFVVVGRGDEIFLRRGE